MRKIKGGLHSSIGLALWVICVLLVSFLCINVGASVWMSNDLDELDKWVCTLCLSIPVLGLLAVFFVCA
jgi:hypothetical protein